MSNDAATITQAEHEAALAQHLAERETKIARLEERVAMLEQALYGRRSERQVLPPDAPFQSDLFTEEGVELEPAESELTEELPKKTRGPSKPRYSEDVPREPEEIELPESELECSACGEKLQSIGVETCERVDVVPARVIVRVERRHKYACKCKDGGVRTAPPVPTAFPRSRVTDGTRAHVIVSKFVDHCPYYRQSAILRRSGIEISDSTLGRLGIEAADRLAPIIVAMREELLASSVLQADETTIPVLKTEKAKPGAHRGYLWAYAEPRGTIVYDYARGRSGDHPSGFLDGYEGILQVDRYEGYNQVLAREGVIDVACWAHARRRFIDAERVSGRKARPILESIQKLYAVERKAREEALPPDERSELRKRESVPVLDALWTDLTDLVIDVLPSSPLGDAVSYAMKHWRALTAYVYFGEAEIDNNLIENSMRPVALGRKNYLFAGSELGAEAAAILYSLTESCRRFGLDPHVYLVDVFDRLATIDPTRPEEIRALTPARWKAAQPSTMG